MERTSHSRAAVPLGPGISPPAPPSLRVERRATERPVTTMAETIRQAAEEVAVRDATRLPSLSLAEFCASATDVDPYVVEGLVADRAWSLAIGEPRAMKSMAVMNIAVAVAAGAPSVMGFRINRPGPVLYVLEEGSRYFTANRLRAMAGHYGPGALANFHMAFKERFKLDDPIEMQRLRLAIEEVKPVLLCIDTLGRTFSGDENSKKDVQPALDALDALVEEYALAALLIHHTGKGAKGSKTSRTRGSSAIVASTQATLFFDVDVVGGLKVPRGDFEVESKDSEEIRYRWSFDSETFAMNRLDDDVTPTPAVIADLVADVIQNGSTATSTTLLSAWTLAHPNRPYGKSVWLEQVARAVAEGKVNRQGSGNKVHYVLPLSLARQADLDLVG